MAFIDVYNAANNEYFQARCLVAAREIARAITSGETVTMSDSTSLNSMEGSVNFAKRLLRKMQTISMEQTAVLILTNTTIAANPDTTSDGSSQDNDILWQTKENWPIYIEIG